MSKLAHSNEETMEQIEINNLKDELIAIHGPIQCHPTLQPTPNKDWDYVAYFDPEGIKGLGATKEAAIKELLLSMESA